MKRAALAAWIAFGLGCGGPDPDMARAEGELPQAIREAERIGLPMKADAVVPASRAVERNAAPVLAECLKALEEEPESGGPLDCAVQASLRPEYVVPRAVRSPEFDDLAGLQTLHAELMARAAQQADDPDKALADLQAARRLAGLAAQVPYSAGLLTAARLAINGLPPASALAGKWSGDPGRMSRLQAALAATGPAYDLADALRGEFSLGLDYLRNLDAYGGAAAADQILLGELSELPAPTGPLSNEGAPEGAEARAFMARHLQVFAELLQRLKKSPGLLDQAITIQEESERLLKEGRPSYRLIRANMMVHRQTGVEAMRALAAEEVLGAAAALHAWRAEKGRYPESLEEAGIVGLDRLAGQDLKYRRTENGFAVWSVGFDGQDNFGTGREPKAAEEADIVIEWPPAAAGR